MQKAHQSSGLLNKDVRLLTQPFSSHSNGVEYREAAARLHQWNIFTTEQKQLSRWFRFGSRGCSFIKVTQMSFATELNNSKSMRSGKLRTWGSGADIGMKNVWKDLKEREKKHVRKTHQLRWVNNWIGGGEDTAGWSHGDWLSGSAPIVVRRSSDWRSGESRVCQLCWSFSCLSGCRFSSTSKPRPPPRCSINHHPNWLWLHPQFHQLYHKQLSVCPQTCRLWVWVQVRLKTGEMVLLPSTA